jgi:hypothetical protein
MTKKMIPEMFRLDPVAAENEFGFRPLFWLAEIHKFGVP